MCGCPLPGIVVVVTWVLGPVPRGMRPGRPGGAVIALTAVEKPVKDPNSETQSFDRNTLVDAVKHSGKVQI